MIRGYWGSVRVGRIASIGGSGAVFYISIDRNECVRMNAGGTRHISLCTVRGRN
jgi:hypothetical protein